MLASSQKHGQESIKHKMWLANIKAQYAENIFTAHVQSIESYATEI